MYSEDIKEDNLWLMKGDCLERMKEIPDGSVDLILTDPPYGTTACKWDSVIPLDKMWEQLKRVVKPNGAIVLFGSEPFSSMLRCSELGWYKYDWIWQKNNAGNFQLSNSHPLKIHENISVFYNTPPCYVFSSIIKQQMLVKNIDYGKVSALVLSKNNKPTGWLSNKLNGSQLPTFEQWSLICGLFEIENEYQSLLESVPRVTYNKSLSESGKIVSNKGKAGRLCHLSSKEDYYTQRYTGYPKTILKFNRESGLHPTQKPVSLMEYLIRTYTNENETVLDFTMGSGTTGVACVNTNRKFIGIEQDDKYFDISVKRIKGELCTVKILKKTTFG